MKRQLCLSLLFAALAAPAAYAGSDIVKCVDGGGHVTLTDQPCHGGSATVRLAGSRADQDETLDEVHPLASARLALPAPAMQRRQAAPRAKARPMQLDVATLKAARAQFLLEDMEPRRTFATLD